MPFENIHNYYEQLVLQHIQEKLTQEKIQHDNDFLEDVACVALNNLPSRYVRHNVDMLYYLTPEERNNMFDNIAEAVTQAIAYVSKHKDQAPRT